MVTLWKPIVITAMNKMFLKKIKKITGLSDIIHDNFNKRNKKVIEQKIDDRRKMNIKYERDFKEHLQKKLNKLDNRLNKYK